LNFGKGVPLTDFRGRQNGKKNSRGAKSHFLAKNSNFFQKLTFFSEKFVHQGGGAAAPLYPTPPPGMPMNFGVGIFHNFNLGNVEIHPLEKFWCNATEHHIAIMHRK